MYINLSRESGVPIYEQIKNQIRSQILKGELKEGEMLPSIRTLARELKIGVITAKRTYDDLCAEGFVISVPAKGVFVSHVDVRASDDYIFNEMEKRLDGLYSFATSNAVEKEKVVEIVENSLEKFKEEY